MRYTSTTFSAAVLSLLSVVAYWAWLFSCLMSLADTTGGSDMFLVGCAALCHVAIYGLAAASFPRAELRGKGRHARMGEQKGHTTMLFYFLGAACLVEYCKKATKLNFFKLHRNFRFHAIYFCSIQLLLCLYTLRAQEAKSGPLLQTSGVIAGLFLANFFAVRSHAPAHAEMHHVKNNDD